MATIDVLMVTYRSPDSTRIALGSLLESCDESMRVWLWHNGDHEETLSVVRHFARDPRVHRFHHSRENVRLWRPTNWLLEEATGDLLSKVDDDNVLPLGWTGPLLDAHHAYERFGVLGCWRFQDEDFAPELASKKIREFPGGHRVMLNFWVEGSCFLMKRRCREEQGVLRPRENFTQYCKRLSLNGWVNGWYYPFIRYENLDDPRCPNSLIRSERDLQQRLPLTAQYNGVRTIDQWTEQLRRSARVAQSASIDPAHWSGWRRRVRNAWRRVQRMAGKRAHW